MSVTDLTDFANLAITKRPRRAPVPTDGLWTSCTPVYLDPSPIPGQDDVNIPTYYLPRSLPRNGHRACANESGDVYFYGGVYGSEMDELFHYSVANNTVTLLKCRGDLPGPRHSHAMTAVGNIIAIHGGDFMRGYKDPDLYLLDLASREWSRIAISGRAPGHVWRHATAVIGMTIYIFCGMENSNYAHSNKLWAFNLDRLGTAESAWELVEPSSPTRPIARYDSTLVSYRDRLFVFGGFSMTGYLGDVWCFDTKSRMWSELRCTGDIPPPRAEHTAVILDDVMYIIGGYNYTTGKKTFVKDVFALKVSEQRWFNLRDADTAPKPRTGHASTCNGIKIFTFGGELDEASEEHRLHILDAKYINNPNLHTPERLKKLDIFGVISINSTSKNDSQETEVSRRGQIVSHILKYPSNKNSLAGLQRTDAQMMVDFLAHELDSLDILQSNAHKRHILHFLTKLAKSAQIFPKSTELSDVQCILTNPANNQGGYGFIYKGEFRNQAVCVKAVHVMGSDADADKMLRAQAGELVLLAHVSHPNVIPLYGAYLSSEEVPRICIVSPWMENGDLIAYLRRKSPNDDQKILLALDTAAGLRFLHNMDVIHADLKAKNVLISRSHRALLADFGVSTVLHTNVGTTTARDFGGSHLWMAPELLTTLAGGNPPVPTKESDIWGLACIFYEMFTGEIPFFGHYSRYPMLLMIAFVNGRKISPLRPKEDSEPVRAQGEHWVPLAERCWNVEPSKRPTATEVVQTLTELNVGDDRPSMDEELATFEAIKESRVHVEIDYHRILSIVQNA